jgi:DNA-binding NarL/FixJ family response regulator
VRATVLRQGAQEYVVLSYPLTAHALPEGLTQAEREVTTRLLAGEGYAQIAARRGVAVRTVANQVTSIFRKLGVSSRLELAVRLGETRPSDDTGGDP